MPASPAPGAPAPLLHGVARVTCLEQKSGHSPPPICHCQHPDNRHLPSSKLLRCPRHPTLTPTPLLSSQGGSQAGPSVGRWEACGHPHMAAETPVNPWPPALAPGGVLWAWAQHTVSWHRLPCLFRVSSALHWTRPQGAVTGPVHRALGCGGWRAEGPTGHT